MNDQMPNGYEAGFAAGERRAFEHRRMGVTLQRTEASSPYQRGFWDGYCPRSAAWAVTVRSEFDAMQGLNA